MEEILHQAEQLEKDYDWLGTAESYKKALNLLPEDDFSRKGDITERLGYASYRAAFQAETNEEFRNRLRQSTVAYGKAIEFYGRQKESVKTARTLRCNAMIAYAGYWLAPEAQEKKRFIDECWKLAIEALKAFDEAGEVLEYGKTYNQLSASASHLHGFEWNFQAREKIVRNSMEHGERAITVLSTLGDFHELARAYVKTAHYLEVLGGYFPDSDKQKKCFQKAAGYWLKADELSEETAMIELPTMGGSHFDRWGPGTDKALMNFKKALEYGRKTRDNFTVGCAQELLAYNTGWKAIATEDPDERIELYKRTLQYNEDAKHSYSLISFVSPSVEAPHAEHYMWLARFVETNPSKRRELLEKALEAAPDLLKRAENSGYPETLCQVENIFSRILWLLAMTETNFDEKKKLLEKALKHSNDSIRLFEQIEPTDYWNQGVFLTGLARIKSELADLAKDPETKKNMLQQAMLDYENLRSGTNWLESLEVEAQIPLYAVVGIVKYEYGNLLNRLYGFTNDRKYLRRAVEVFEEAAKSFQKPNLISRLAECCWKTANVYDNLGEHLKAAENFSMASDNYRSAAEKIPQLKDFYQDHGLYMQAWSEIEKARYHHQRQEYESAKEHFEKATDVHNSLKKWKYLAPNYSAWAQVEDAEDLSRREHSEEAIIAFEKATGFFIETKKSIQAELSKIESPEEKQMAANMVKTTDLRREYCRARIAIEEAKILDKKGDHHLSSEKYSYAANALERLGQALESEQERTEMKFITVLANAWQEMVEAKAEESPQHYAEASRLFETAKDLGQGEKMKALVLGHSRFCMALEAGAKFADTRDMAEYSRATQYLESASGYYLKADFQSASDYVKATRFLFDAYVHMGNAAREIDLEKKSRLYMIAEKILQASVDSYTKAGNPSGREQALKLFETAREQREISVSLAEMLYAPIVASTTAFTAPPPTSEKATGVERFEHAEMNANLILDRRELQVGENLDLEIELANAGKGQALLTQIERAVPEGFELGVKPELYRVEGFNINMKGKRLDPLKAEEVKFSLKAKHKGSFTIGPTVRYLDENGNAKSHKPEPVVVTVKELGISGWIKGER